MKTIALAFAMAGLTWAQAAGPEKAEFEVASIHPSKDDGHHSSDSDGGMLRIHNYALKRLIGMAWQIDASQIYGGPNWLDSDSYDITAKIPEQFVGHARETRPLMIQSLLADRFQLVIHREPREISGFALTLAKKGPKMERAKPDDKDSGINQKNTHLIAKNVTMEAFARDLSGNRDVGALVSDRTGLTGGFGFVLDWTPERLNTKSDASSDDRPSIFTALQEQLGLKLESARVPVMAIVVDSAEKPDSN